MLKRVYIEITNVCNLACAFCPGTRRKRAFLAPEDFAGVLLRLRGITEHIYLHVMGEPLLHPDLPALLSLAGEAGYHVYITTNGTLLGEKGALLLSAPVRRIKYPRPSGRGVKGCFSYSSGMRPAICSLIFWNVSSDTSCSIRQASSAAVSGETPRATSHLHRKRCRS